MDIDLTQFTDLELVLLQSTARDNDDADLVKAILIELGRRDRARSSAETESA